MGSRNLSGQLPAGNQPGSIAAEIGEGISNILTGALESWVSDYDDFRRRSRHISDSRIPSGADGFGSSHTGPGGAFDVGGSGPHGNLNRDRLMAAMASMATGASSPSPQQSLGDMLEDDIELLAEDSLSSNSFPDGGTLGLLL